MLAQLLLVCFSAALPVPPCNLNGVLNAGECLCDAAWTGASCDTLAVLPVPRHAGYRQPHTSSWGGNAVYDNTTELYHGFFSDLVNHWCVSRPDVNRPFGRLRGDAL